MCMAKSARIIPITNTVNMEKLGQYRKSRPIRLVLAELSVLAELLVLAKFSVLAEFFCIGRVNVFFPTNVFKLLISSFMWYTQSSYIHYKLDLVKSMLAYLDHLKAVMQDNKW